ncbi:TonB-dependent receptor [Pseudomaricurvus sp.]|uniref:TonB-dependent receptor n=1 Tax=Pseudomaricurvus sp. TaxID=2004510 RepID=UPI003F6D689F
MTKPLTIHALSAAVAIQCGLASSVAVAAGVPGLIEETLVVGQLLKLDGEATSASVGTVSQEQLAYRPLLRPAEVLETVPGMVVTQHSGDGKANQYFLRGFNLDHGTDFATYVEGMPVNMVTHGHGQGYADLNFLIPELVQSMTYKKGPYYASEGDFSSAGSAHARYTKALSDTQLKLTVGEHQYQRALLTSGVKVGEGNLVVGAEMLRNNGPWDLEEDLKKNNGVVKYTQGDQSGGFSVTAMAYENEWNSSDQIPKRTVDQGEIDRLGYLTPYDGGDTHRYSLSSGMWGELGEGRFRASAYVIDYALKLTSNFTYFANDPVNGDEFTQFDDRTIWGGEFVYDGVFSESTSYQLGTTLRYDDIGEVGVGSSQKGHLADLWVSDSVEESSVGIFASLNHVWTPWLSTELGVRYDYFSFDVDSDLYPENSGHDSEGKVSPKLSITLGPWAETEFFINYGKGIHSNDARGVVATIDPVNPGGTLDSVDPIAQSTGYELGLRTAIISGAQISMALFQLDLDSELVFVGDEGTTEPRGATRRRGLEIGIYYELNDWLIVDADAALSQARFRDEQYDDAGGPIGKHLPDSMERVYSVGLTASFDSGLHAGLRGRYFGPRDLNEAGSITSDSTTTLNANLFYEWANGWTAGVEVLNLLDSEDDDITYYFESLTASELAANMAPVEDYHFHPVEPRTFRVTLGKSF